MNAKTKTALKIIGGILLAGGTVFAIYHFSKKKGGNGKSMAADFPIGCGSGKNNPNQSVKVWQDFLRGKGYNIATDGLWGKFTERASRLALSTNSPIKMSAQEFGLYLGGDIPVKEWSETRGNDQRDFMTSATKFFQTTKLSSPYC